MRAFRRRLTRGMLLAAIGCPIVTFAQTSGTWAVDVGTTGGNWSAAANWLDGVVPDNGGIASFVTLPTFTTAPINIIQDNPTVTLSGVTFDGLITYLIRPLTAGTQTLTLTGPANVHLAQANINTISTTFFGHQLQIPIAGTAGLNKSGPGTVTLWSPNTYSGDTTISGGIVVARQFGDAVFGDPSGAINLNDGTIRVTTAAWTSSRTINLAGTSTFEPSTGNPISFNGPVTGVGSLNKIGNAGLVMTAGNSYSGSTNVLAATITLSGNGAVEQTSSLTSRGAIVLDNSLTNLTNRVNDVAPVRLEGSVLSFTGNPSAASSETLGPVTFSRGTTPVTVAPGSGQMAAISTGNVSRDVGGTAFVRGTNLGAAPGANVANLSFATLPGLVGGGGATGSTNISIIPWAFGNTNTTATTTDLNNSFLTYGATGLRPLNTTTEYANTFFNAMNPTDNVRLGAADSVSTPKTINSLILTGSGLITGSATLTMTSGALMNPGFAQIQCPIDFSAAEGILHAAGSLTLSGVVSGSGGITKQGAGIATFANAANTYSGMTILGSGTTVFLADVTNSGAPSPLGSSTSAIVLAPAGMGIGGTTARLVYGGPGTADFDRDLIVSGRVATNNAAILPGFGVNGAGALNMNGNITLDDSPMTFVSGDGGNITVNGDITGSGGPITNQGAIGATIVLNGNNTFSGGAELSQGTWVAGSDSAFGAGMLKMVQQPTIRAEGVADGGTRIIPNEAVSFSFGSNYWDISGSQPITFTGSINLSGSYTHNITNSALTTYAGVLHTGGFTKSGPGTLVLSGNNIYTGNTTVSSGVLRIAHANALGTPEAPTIVNSFAALEIGNDVLSQEPVLISGIGVSGNPRGAVRSLSGANTLGPLTLSSTSGPTAIFVESGSLAVGNVGISGGSPSLQIAAFGSLAARRFRVAWLLVDGNVAVMPGRSTDKTSVVTNLSVGSNARLDLGDNDLVLDHTGSDPLPLVQSLISAAYNGGDWDGPGITSSQADASNFALGFARATSIFFSFPAIFSGVTVDGTSVLIRWTRYGDANLDGVVNLDDFNRLAANFGNASATWTIGDFDYNGIVNLADFNKLAANFGLSAGPDGPTSADWAALASVVPEAATLALAGLAASPAMLRPRRRRQN